MWILNFFLITGFSVAVQGPPERVRALVDHVFVAEHGFDDNDEVVLVLDGRLPNSCYILGETQVKRDAKGGFEIVQNAVKRSLGFCDSESLPPHLALPHRFNKELVLGQLPQGQYQVRYGEKHRSFEIVDAKSDNVDELPYAPVAQAFIPELVFDTDVVQALLSGVIESSCIDLNDVASHRVGDVVIVLPTLRANKEFACEPLTRAMDIVVSLGRLDVGRYLLHVRTMNGNSVNRVFTVVKRGVDPRKKDSRQGDE